MRQLPVIDVDLWKFYDELGELYDELYLKAQQVLDQYNPCNISSDGKSCTGGTPCCGGCEHLGLRGCTVQSLACKFWLCSYAKEKNQECAVELEKLLQIAQDQGVPRRARYSKQENFKRIYCRR